MAQEWNNSRRSMPEPITVIIPAYNEEKRIGQVLDVVVRAPLITHIVVVDDGSRDGTAEVVRRWQGRDLRIRLLRRERNRGKAAAIALGGQHAASDIVVLLDADLMGLQPLHVQRLIGPVRRRECAMTSGLFQNGRRSTDMTHRFLPFLSGQRCLRWSLFKEALSSPSAGWSLETALNLHAWYYQYAVRRVPWQGVTHAMRPEKHPGLGGYVSHVTMWSHILKYTWQFAGQVGFGAIIERLRTPEAAELLPHDTARTRRPVLMRRPLL